MPPDKKSPRMQHLHRFSGAFVAILLLVVVFCSVATITTPSVVAATTHPIEYQIGCPPSMVNDGSLDYFKAHGFSVVYLVVPDTGTYQAAVSYTHLRAHETPEHLVCRLLLENKKKTPAHIS